LDRIRDLKSSFLSSELSESSSIGFDLSPFIKKKHPKDEYIDTDINKGHLRKELKII